MLRSMKIVSDFDGVLTDISEEADRMKETFIQFVGKVNHLSPEASHQLVADAEKAFNEFPHQHGWRMKNRVSAFWNEDKFIYVNAIAAYLDDRKDLKPNFSLMQQPSKSYTDLAMHAFYVSAHETKSGVRNPIDPEAIEVLRGLLNKGAEIVIVSNSGTERIVDLLVRSGLPPSEKFRVRGHAKKFMLGDKASTFSVGPYLVDIDRPSYQEILREERPDVLLGDVFSLDLATPIELTRAQQIKLKFAILRKRPYTPKWSYDYLTAMSGGETQGVTIDRFNQLTGIL